MGLGTNMFGCETSEWDWEQVCVAMRPQHGTGNKCTWLGDLGMGLGTSVCGYETSEWDWEQVCLATRPRNGTRNKRVWL